MRRTTRGKGKNKFLPSFDEKKMKKLRSVLVPLTKSAYSPTGLVRAINDILLRPSSLRKCDVVSMGQIFKALDKL